MHEVFQFLRENPTFFLATMDGDQPRVRPFGAVSEFEGKLYFITSNQKDVFRQMQKNPKIEICAADAAGAWLRITASIHVDPRREPKERMLEESPMLKDLYSPDDGVMEVFYLENATAVFSSLGGPSHTVRF